MTTTQLDARGIVGRFMEAVTDYCIREAEEKRRLVLGTSPFPGEGPSFYEAWDLIRRAGRPTHPSPEVWDAYVVETAEDVHQRATAYTFYAVTVDLGPRRLMLVDVSCSLLEAIEHDGERIAGVPEGYDRIAVIRDGVLFGVFGDDADLIDDENEEDYVPRSRPSRSTQ